MSQIPDSTVTARVIDDRIAAADAIQHVSIHEAQLFLAHIAERRPKLFLEVVRVVREQAARTADLVADPPSAMAAPVNIFSVAQSCDRSVDDLAEKFGEKWANGGTLATGRMNRGV